MDADTLAPPLSGATRWGIRMRHSLVARTTLLLAVAVAATTLIGARPGTTPAAEAAGLTLQPIASGLDAPLAVVDAGDGSGRLFIVEQTGKIKIWNGTSVLATAFLDVGPLVSCCGEQGLLGLAFHPSYETNGLFYINYTDNAGDTVISRYSVSGNPNIANATGTPILTIDQPQPNHNGGQLAFGPDGYLYIGMGDGGGQGDPSNLAQNIESLLGKILRIDVNAPTYAIPPDNPLVGQAGRDEIWAIGLRNPWRFSFDRQNGDLWIADVGEDIKEEVNLQPTGTTALRNYGWRLMEGTSCYNPPVDCNPGTLTLPTVEYAHGEGDCAITGGYRYRGSAVPFFAGKYLYGDYCSGRIWAASQSGATWSSLLLIDSSMFVSSFGEDEAGELYVADHAAGVVYKINAPPDSDGDGVVDPADNCETVPNPSQLNTDAANTAANRPGADALGDACDADRDGDGYLDTREDQLGENPLLYCTIMRADVDGDGVVSILDLSRLASDFTKSIPPAPERHAQDADAQISILDLSRAASVYVQRVAACSQ